MWQSNKPNQNKQFTEKEERKTKQKNERTAARWYVCYGIGLSMYSIWFVAVFRAFELTFCFIICVASFVGKMIILITIAFASAVMYSKYYYHHWVRSTKRTVLASVVDRSCAHSHRALPASIASFICETVILFLLWTWLCLFWPLITNKQKDKTKNIRETIQTWIFDFRRVQYLMWWPEEPLNGQKDKHD